MFIKVSVPGQFRLKMMPSFRSFLMHRDGEVHYIGGTDILPAPFDSVREAEVLRKFGTSEDKEARSALIEHNLRLVVYIARKFDNTSVGVEDLISIGTIGLIKAINTFDVDKNIKLATYASRCIENEILMYLRRNNKTKLEVSIDEPLNVDWDGNELLLSDILGTDEDIIYRDLEDETERKLLNAAIDRLNPREQKIVKLRFGLGREQEDEMTQKEVADLLGISQVKKWICDKMQTGPEDQGGYAAIMAHMKALQVVAEPIGVAKHVFSHVQWDMVGYRVKILCENNGNTEELLENISENEHFFMVDKTALKEEYSVPSAFGAYIRLLG